MIAGEDGVRFAVILTEAGFPGACVARAIVLTRLKAPENYSQRCQLRALIDAENLARQGGAMIYRTQDGYRIKRSITPGTARPWTPRGGAAQE